MASPWVKRWEGLSSGVQAAVAMPIAAVLMFLLHIGPLNQPTARAIGYSLFWGAIATVAVVVASRSERARRLERERTTGRKDPNE